MKIHCLFIVLISFLSLTAQENVKPELKPYVNFLNETEFQSAKEYIFQKFESKDIVILSERDHRDLMQYEVIIDVLKDSRFKGNIFTEVGCQNNAQKINNFLLNSNLTEEEKKLELVSIFRDLDYYIIWDKYNFYMLLDAIFNINKPRKKEDKILLFPLDLKFNWEDITCSAQYQLFDDYSDNDIIDRDAIMGKHFRLSYEYAKKRNPDRKKALVIQNTYHGYIRIPTFLPNPTCPDIFSASQYIYKTYPNITTNIYINYFSQNFANGLTNNGLFDAAFAMAKVDNVGFDLKNTPFGNTTFDLYNFGGSDYEVVNFDYVFDGMIFYKPVLEMKLATGIPNVYPTAYEKQFFERMALIDDISYEEAVKKHTEYLKEINTLKHYGWPDSIREKIEEQIRFWTKK